MLKTLTADDIVDGNAICKNAQIVPLKYISSFFRSLEMPLINTKLYIQLDYTKNSVVSSVDGSSTIKTTKTEPYPSVVILKTEDNNKLNELLDSEFKSKIEDVIQPTT